jgi:flagellar hook-associated protein 1 FlgK
MSSISSFFGLQTALRGLQAQQRELDVTAHNVANASTDGYTRQQVNLSAVLGIDVPAGALANGAGAMLGGGVDVQSYTRARDQFADLQFRAQSGQDGYATQMASALSTTELSLNEPGDNGIAKLLSNFWDSWHDVSNNPQDTAVKNALVVNAKALADGIRGLDSQLTSIQQDAQGQIDALTSTGGTILSDARAIAKLNVAIDRAVTAGQQPNDLLDQRDKLVDELSGLGQVTVTQLSNGGIQVAFGGVSSPLLVDDQTAWQPTAPSTTLYPTPAAGGKLGALQQIAAVPGGTIDTYRQQLDAFVNQLVGSVNTAHGAPFFAAGGTTAATIAIDAGIAANPATVRTTNVAGSPPGANDVALAVAGLRGGTADKAYGDFVLRVGSDSRDATRQQTATSATLAAAQSRRDSVSGVSLDEEMANMIRFQRGYQASARTMSTMDEMLDTLINRTGRVGL